MPKLIIMNNCTEQMLGKNITSKEGSFAAKAAWRNAWLADISDIIVTPVSFSEGFLPYIGNLLSFDHTLISLICGNDAGSESPILTDEVLLSPMFMERIRSQAEQIGSLLRIMPAFYTQGVAELASILGIDDSIGRRFAAQRGTDLLNRKTHFRRFAVGIGLPVAAGSIVDTPDQLEAAIRLHLNPTGIAIVKRDCSAGGLGNVAVTIGRSHALPGCRETRQMSQQPNLLAADLWEDLQDSSAHELVVETYHSAAHMFYLEYVVPEDGIPVFLTCGSIKLRSASDPNAKELIWVGLEIPAELPDPWLHQAMVHGNRLAQFASGLGYRGYLNIDAIVTDGGELIFNEVNGALGRWHRVARAGRASPWEELL